MVFIDIKFVYRWWKYFIPQQGIMGKLVFQSRDEQKSIQPEWINEYFLQTKGKLHEVDWNFHWSKTGQIWGMKK